MRKPAYRFSIAGQPVYPHIKFTSENFPRALATRILEDDGDEYFGAFLNRTSVRILIDFLNRTFRLRSCKIAVDGTFPVPCTQFYIKRCVAPCVASLCDSESYLEMVDLARLFLRNDREIFLSSISHKIERAAEALDFETAAILRDILQAVEAFWANSRWQVWLDDTVDSYEIEWQEDVLYVILVSQRRRRILGERVYAFHFVEDVDPTLALGDVIREFYIHHVPREIRVSHDFHGRAALAKDLGKRFGRKINIVVSRETNRLVASARAVDLTKARLAMERSRVSPSPDEIARAIAGLGGLRRIPKRIEAFDAAHISATGFAAAVSVWQKGKELPDEYEHWISDRTSELDTLRAFIADRISRSEPDLILVDGGKAQLRAAIDAVEKASLTTAVIAAVKPKARHSSISHFLTGDGRQFAYDQDNHSHRVLARLRDDAHDLANATHRLGRDMLHFYELAAMLPSLDERERQTLLKEMGSIRRVASLDKTQLETRLGKKKGMSAAADIQRFDAGDAPPPQPLIVPIAYVATDGAAGDLIPIANRG
jgi:excinuclease ABC subunit C